MEMTPVADIEAQSRPHTDAAAIVLIAFVVLSVFAGTLVVGDDTVVSHPQGDTALYHIYLRPFGVHELREGNLPLWNPHIFSGTPYLGGFQSALLYPPNVIYFLLPIQKAVNWDFAIHLFLLGVFSYVWLRRWHLHWLGAWYASLVIMLCGATFLRVLAGQINVIATLAWLPLLLMSVDGIVTGASWKRFPSGWCILGIIATTLLVLAGYPQALFMSAFCTAIYTLARLPAAANLAAAAAQLAIVALLPVFLSAIQLWTAVEVGLESIRGGEVTYEFASSFSFPPEKVVTMLAPAFFGDMLRAEPWGRWGFWDDSLYLGVGTLFLIAAGLFRDRRHLKWISLLLVAITLLIALGRYTPVHQWLFAAVPGFDKFRAPSKFLFFTSFFFAVLAAFGVDHLWRHPERARAFSLAAFSTGATLVLGASAIAWIDRPAENGLWWRLLSTMKSTPDTYLWFQITPDYVTQTAHLARTNLLLGGLAAFVTGTLMWGVPINRRFLHAAVFAGALELILFAHAYRATFDLRDIDYPVIDRAVAAAGDEDRILPLVGFDNKVSNYAIRAGGRAVWGYDPVILRRYGELMSTAAGGRDWAAEIKWHVFTWGTEPFGQALRLQVIDPTLSRLINDPRLLQMLRCETVIQPVLPKKYESLLNQIRLGGSPENVQVLSSGSTVTKAVYSIPETLPRFHFVTEYRVLPAGDAVLDAVDSETFLPGQMVILEEEPVPAPSGPVDRAQIEVEDTSTDHVTLRVEISDPAILVVTDAYSEGWRAVPLEDSVQTEYKVLPANHAIRAIPLAAGTHHFRMEYAPAAFRYGRMATVIAAIVFAGLVILWAVQIRHGKTANAEDGANNRG